MENSSIPTAFSVSIVIGTVIDFILKPKDRWEIYSKATDLIAVGIAKKQGDYEENKDLLDLILETESSEFDNLVNLNDLKNLVDKMQNWNALT